MDSYPVILTKAEIHVLHDALTVAEAVIPEGDREPFTNLRNRAALWLELMEGGT